jgi:Tol biopolymer transport system component
MRSRCECKDRHMARPAGQCWSLLFALALQVRHRVWLPLFAVSAVSYIIVGCRSQEYFFDVTGELSVVSASQHYDEAVARAEDWKADAYLASIRADVGSAADTDGRLLFQFDSPSAPLEYYSLDFADNTWHASVEEVGPASLTQAPIEREDWVLDTVDAWSIGLANGVEDFLLKYQEPTTIMGVDLDYYRTRSGVVVLAWRVHSWLINGATTDLLIDPGTGEIIETMRSSMSGTRIVTTIAGLPACTRVPVQPSGASELAGRIALESNRTGWIHTYLMDLDGSNVVRLMPETRADQGAAWSPDGRRIAFASSTADDFDIYIVDSDGGNLVRLTDHPANDVEPTWSPDGARIAFSSDRDGTFNIYVVDDNGSNLARLTQSPLRDGSPDWSPDGSRIAFDSEREPLVESYICTVEVGGSNLTQLTDGTNLDFDPRWSPDGGRIAFWSYPRVEGQLTPNIYVMYGGGSSKVALTSGPCGGQYPVWSPDGTRILFSITSANLGQSDIFVMDADGSNVVRLTNETGLNIPRSWRP